MASYPPIFVTINGNLLNAADVQQARAAEGDAGGVLVHFISGGWATVPGITVEELEAVLASAVTAAAPF